MTPTHYTAIVVAPSGELMHWTHAHTGDGAILAFLPDLREWAFARSQGYRVRWFAPKLGRPVRE